MPYSSMSQVNPAIKGIRPPVTLAQANAIANQAEGIPEGQVDSPWAVAINKFKQSHVVKNGKWVRKEGSEYGKKKKEYVGGIKGIEYGDKRYLAIWTTNAFEDREEETFSTKSISDYVVRADTTGHRGRVWLWHIKGTDFADIVWQDMVGRMLLELAEVDDTPYANKMYHAITHPEEFPDLLPLGWGASHGYVYLPGTKARGTYHFFHKFETTILPYHRASNAYTNVMEVKSMKVTSEKKDLLTALVGEDQAKAILDATAEASKALEKANVSFKADGEEPDEEEEMEEEEAEEEEAEEESKELDGQVMEIELDEPLLKEIASYVDVSAAVKEAVEAVIPVAVATAIQQYGATVEKAVKEAVASANVESKETIIQQALSGTMTLKPYAASKDKDNVLQDAAPVAGEKGTDGKADGDVVKQLVANLIG